MKGKKKFPSREASLSFDLYYTCHCAIKEDIYYIKFLAKTCRDQTQLACENADCMAAVDLSIHFSASMIVLSSTWKTMQWSGKLIFILIQGTAHSQLTRFELWIKMKIDF